LWSSYCTAPFACRYLTLAQAQAKALRVDWSDPINKPVRPSLLGAKSFMSFPIEEVLDYIDWNPFFQVKPRRHVLRALCAVHTGQQGRMMQHALWAALCTKPDAVPAPPSFVSMSASVCACQYLPKAVLLAKHTLYYTYAEHLSSFLCPCPT
jgi:hypothetical protein